MAKSTKSRYVAARRIRFVVTVINGVCGETHKDAYMPVFWLTVVTPLIATAVGVVLFTLFPNLP